MPSLLALALLLAGADPGPDDPRSIVRSALAAVEGDSVRAVGGPWERRLARDSSDRAAALGVATIARLTYDYPTAERLYARLQGGASPSPDRYAVYAHLGHAELEEARGGDDASVHTTRARSMARALGDPVAEGEALIAGAFALARSEGLARGLAALDTAERLIPAELADVHSRRLWVRAVLLVVSRHPDAVAVTTQALELGERSGTRRSAAQALRVLGLEMKFRGEVDSALAYLDRAQALQERLRDRRARAYTLMFIAETLIDVGRYGEAQAMIDRAIAEAQASGYRGGIAIGHNARAYVALHVGDYATAGEHLRRAIPLFERENDPANVLIARRMLAQARLGAGDVEAAERDAAAVLEALERDQVIDDQLAVHDVLIAARLRVRDADGAARRIAEARAAARRHGMKAWSTALLFDEARLALLRGDERSAERRLRDYLRSVDTSQAVARHDARARLAELYARWGELDRAERELLDATIELDRWRATLSAPALRVLAFHAATGDAIERDGSIATVLAALASNGRAETAFELAERRRARELADRLNRADALRAGGAPHRPARPRAAPAAPPASADAAASNSGERTALLEFVAGRNGAPTTLFVRTRGALRAYTLPPEDSIAGDVARFVSLLESGADPGALARALGAALLDGALAGMPRDVDRLVVVPDGALHRLPFDALRLADGRYAAERFAISVAPSGAVLAILRSRRARERDVSAGARLLAFGDPTFAGERTMGRRAALRDAFDRTGGLPRLAASGREARLVARYAADADVRLREEATAASLRSDSLARYDIVHFATHALVDDRSIARTALALAPSEGSDGFVGAGELAALRLDADLVVLSACRTAGGVIVGGEGVQGLTAPLLQAGARAVVATQWRIEDERTVAFIEDFYDAMADGLAVGDALRAAKRAAIARGAPPAEWAAFTLVGDPLVRIPLRHPSPLSAPWMAAALAGLALGAAAAGVLLYSSRTRSARAAERRSAPSPA